MMIPREEMQLLQLIVKLNPSDEKRTIGKANWTWVTGEVLNFYSITGSFWQDQGKFLIELIDEKLHR